MNCLYIVYERYPFRLNIHAKSITFEGDKTVQCGRKVDVLKLWLLWKSRGNDGMAKQVENSFENAKYTNFYHLAKFLFKGCLERHRKLYIFYFISYLVEQLKKRDGFRLVMPEVCHISNTNLQIKQLTRFFLQLAIIEKSIQILGIIMRK